MPLPQLQRGFTGSFRESGSEEGREGRGSRPRPAMAHLMGLADNQGLRPFASRAAHLAGLLSSPCAHWFTEAGSEAKAGA